MPCRPRVHSLSMKRQPAHRGRHLERLMDANEAVEHGVEQEGARMVLDLL
jgi:hypothetical protein